MKPVAWAVAFGVAIGLLAGGVIFLVSRPARGQPIDLIPPPDPKPVIVHVTGSVNQPGVYTLPYGSRISDAVQAAAGFTQDADQDKLNLAQLLRDGDQIRVPAKLVLDEGNSMPVRLETLPVSQLVNINTATQAELELLPRIGPATAQAIIAYREQNGPFRSVDDLQKVPGIGPATLAELKPLITVDDTP